MSRSLIPNSTQIPDVILDFWLSELTGAELKVVLYIARRTYGFGKESDNISLNQICHGITTKEGRVLDAGTGLSRSTVKEACNSLITRGLLIRSNNINEIKGEYEENTYRLNLYAPLPDSAKRVGRKSAPQETAIQETAIQETVIQETAAAETKQVSPKGRTSPVVAAAVSREGDGLDEETQELAQELHSHGVSWKAAVECALNHPKESRRQMELTEELPDTAFSTSRDAYLAAAIPGRFGPLPEYVEFQRQREKDEKAKCKAQAQKAHQSHEEARRAAEEAEFDKTLGQLQQDNPEAHRAFKERVEIERRTEIERKKGEGMKPFFLERLSSHYDTPGKQLEIYRRWLAQYEAASAAAPELVEEAEPVEEDRAEVSVAIAASLGLGAEGR